MSAKPTLILEGGCVVTGDAIVMRGGEAIVSAPVPFDPDAVDLDRRLASPGSFCNSIGNPAPRA